MFATSILVLATALGSGEFPSGPAVGDKLPDFKAHEVVGPDAGKEIKLHDKNKGGPTLVIFVQDVTRPGLGQFLKPVDKYAGENKGVTTQIVWVTGDKDAAEDQIKKVQGSLSYLSPISICLEGGKDGPATYGLNDKVKMTVLVAKDNKVVANFALADPNANDAPKVIAALAKVLGKDPPKLDKKEEKKVRPDGKSPELQTLMRKMINKDNSGDDCKGIAAEMQKWAGRDEAKQKELRDYAQKIVELNYGNEHAVAALKKLAAAK